MVSVYHTVEVQAIADFFYNKRRTIQPSYIAKAREMLRRLGLSESDVERVLRGQYPQARKEA